MTTPIPRKRKSRARQKPVPLATSVATAPQINVFALPAYVPEPGRSVRPGADDHLKVQSRGYRT
ncbi:hypothetical protein MCEMSHM24_02731 [Comamonadaceae bacterium]